MKKSFPLAMIFSNLFAGCLITGDPQAGQWSAFRNGTASLPDPDGNIDLDILLVLYLLYVFVAFSFLIF